MSKKKRDRKIIFYLELPIWQGSSFLRSFQADFRTQTSFSIHHLMIWIKSFVIIELSCFWSDSRSPPSLFSLFSSSLSLRDKCPGVTRRHLRYERGQDAPKKETLSSFVGPNGGIAVDSVSKTSCVVVPMRMSSSCKKKIGEVYWHNVIEQWKYTVWLDSRLQELYVIVDYKICYQLTENGCFCLPCRVHYCSTV